MRYLMRLLPLALLLAALARAQLRRAKQGNQREVVARLSEYGQRHAAIARMLERKCQTTGHECQLACDGLGLLYGNAVVYPESEDYGSFRKAYWSGRQSDLKPACVFKPISDSEVAVHVLIARLTDCKFAVRSGGHTAWAGGSSIENGITLSLEAFNHINIAHDRSTVTIGPGNIWRDVYRETEKHDVVVLGGRIGHVGVGGFLLGGGVSFFVNQYGWACDNVVEHRLVTADGSIIRVNRRSHPDLFWALRGGGNNFGIVVSSTIRAFPLRRHQMWGGTLLHSATSAHELIDAFVGTEQDIAFDTKLSQVLAFASIDGADVGMAVINYAAPSPEPNAIQAYKQTTPLLDTTRTTTLSEIISELDLLGYPGQRWLFETATFKMNQKMCEIVKDVFFELLPSVMDVENIRPLITLQAINKHQMKHMKANGGNALGIADEAEPLLYIDVTANWEQPSDDTKLVQFGKDVIAGIRERAESHGWNHEYVYLNYATPSDKVIQGYGRDNQDRLRQIAQRYDPQGVFQELLPSGWKVNRDSRAVKDDALLSFNSQIEL